MNPHINNSSYKLTLVNYELQAHSFSANSYVNLIQRIDQNNHSIEKIIALRSAISPKDSFYHLQILSSKKIIKSNLKLERKILTKLAIIKRNMAYLEEIKRQIM